MNHLAAIWLAVNRCKRTPSFTISTFGLFEFFCNVMLVWIMNSMSAILLPLPIPIYAPFQTLINSVQNLWFEYPQTSLSMIGKRYATLSNMYTVYITLSTYFHFHSGWYFNTWPDDTLKWISLGCDEWSWTWNQPHTFLCITIATSLMYISPNLSI